MKTKSLLWVLGLTLTGLAAVPRTSFCQIVGYVNVPVTNGYNLIANPLHQPPDNNITNVIPTPPDGSRVYLWDVPSQTFQPQSTYSNCCGWSAILQLPPGKGFAFWASANATITFVGQLLTGSLTNPIAGGNKLSLLAPKFPISGPLSGTNSLQFPGSDGDEVHTFNGTTQPYSDAFTYFAGFGWHDPTGAASTNGPIIGLGRAFFVNRKSPDANWVATYYQSIPPPGGMAPSSDSSVASRGSTRPAIGRLNLARRRVTLEISNTNGGAYDIQFSPDGLSWRTIETKQTAGTWTGPYLGGTQGYYRLVNP
jgi:hypothetical protein